MQGNIRIVLTLSILKKNTVTTDWIENKINKVHNAYLCFIEFKVGNWSEKKTLLALFCIVCQYVISRAGQVRKLVRKYANPQLRAYEKTCGHADLRTLAV